MEVDMIEMREAAESYKAAYREAKRRVPSADTVPGVDVARSENVCRYIRG